MKRLLLALVFVLAACRPSQAAIAVVQSAAATGALDVNPATGVSKAFSANVTAGSAIFVGITGQANFGLADYGTGAVTDGTNTYTRDVITTAHPTGFVFAIFSALNVAGGATTVTVKPTNTASVFFGIVEVSGLATSSAFDVSGQTSAGSGSKVTGNLSGTTAQASEFELVVLMDNDATSASITVDAFSPAYTSIANWSAYTTGSSSSAATGDVSYRILSSTTNVGATWTGSSFDFSAGAATYKASGGGGAPPCRPTLLTQGVSQCGD